MKVVELNAFEPNVWNLTSPAESLVKNFIEVSDVLSNVSGPVKVTLPSKVVVPSAFTLSIGTPDISDIENISPLKSSVIENNCP